MTRLAEGGRAAQPGLACRLWARAIGNPYPPPGILRQHAAKVLAQLAAFTDDYPDAEQDTPMAEVIDGQPICDERAHDCRCRENAGHYPATPHRCPCGGMWNGTEGEIAEVVEWPGGGMAGALELAATGQLLADDEDW